MFSDVEFNTHVFPSVTIATVLLICLIATLLICAKNRVSPNTTLNGIPLPAKKSTFTQKSYEVQLPSQSQIRRQKRQQREAERAEIVIDVADVDGTGQANNQSEVSNSKAVDDVTMMMQAMSPGSLSHLHHASMGLGALSENGLKFMMTGQEPEEEGSFVVFSPAVAENVLETLKRQTTNMAEMNQMKKPAEDTSKDQGKDNAAETDAMVEIHQSDRDLLIVQESAKDSFPDAPHDQTQQ